MGCCASSTSTEPSATVDLKTKKNDVGTRTPVIASEAKKTPIVTAQAEPAPVRSEKIGVAASSAKTPSVKAAAKSVPAPASFAAPAPGVKNVRSAYKGKGWAPQQKEWESNKKQANDKTRIEIEDEWDDDGNLKRTTTKHVTTPDWKKTTETTVEIIPADEAQKMGLGRK
mmetsp:Transcript_3778/g.8145  ORF Transcript_3778/g.8145 Transcript_3778/m.8145 type:complete len:170 (-) Transcript_3778:2481-2990(-)